MLFWRLISRKISMRRVGSDAYSALIKTTTPLRKKSVRSGTTTAQPFYPKRRCVASSYSDGKSKPTWSNTISQTYLTDSNRLRFPFPPERVARAVRLLSQSLAPKMTMPISARRDVKAARRSRPQILNRESNVLRYSLLYSAASAVNEESFSKFSR